MKLYLFIIIVVFLLVGACSDKVIRVDNEFLSEMSKEEIQQMEGIERAIVSISGEKQLILNSLRITELELQIQKQESDQPDGEKSILINKERLYKFKKDPLKQKEVQQALKYTADNITLNELKDLVLKARLADENAQLHAKSAELGEKISEWSLMRAQIARAQQDKVFAKDSGKSGEKTDVSNFEKRLKEDQLILRKKENLRLEAGNKHQEARSALNQKLLWMSAHPLSPLEMEATDELEAESAVPEVIPSLIGITQLEIQILQQEKEQLQRKSSILVDRKRVSKLKNNSIEQNKIQQDLENSAKKIHIQELLAKVLKARLDYENTQIKKQKAVFEQKNAENLLVQAQMKRKRQDETLGDDPKKQANKIDLSTFETQLKKIQSRLQIIDKSLFDQHDKFKEAFIEWNGAKLKPHQG
jgi:hypothetical protein